MLLFALLACRAQVDGPREGPPEPVACPVLHADADGDGFGDPATAAESCAPVAGRVEDGTDCDDTDGAVHPGAADVCDDRPDNDCDGAADPSEVDVDADGFTPCAGDCADADPAAHPDLAEVCNGGIDDDCDGLVDAADDSVDRYSCGYCPDVADLDGATYEVLSYNPCLIDPTVTMCSDDPKRPDTHSFGLHLHRMMRRTDGHPLRDQLLLFLPPGPGDTNGKLLRWAAYAGYPVVSLGWTNEAWVQDCAPDDACFDVARRVLAYGDPADRILPHDSIVGRLEALFAFQLGENPGWGWERWYDAATGEIRWEDIVLVGWSSGGGEAAYIARDHAVEGVISISSPGDTMFDGYGPAPASWMFEPSATPTCAQYGFYHQEEVNSDVVDMFLEGYLAMGLVGPSVDTTLVPPPYGDAQILTTTLTDWTQSWCTFHQAMAMDQCIHDDLVDPYLYLFCSAVGDDACP